MTVRLDQMSLANLAFAKLPRSKNNVVALIAWACGENNSEDISTKAKWNPWDTEQKMSGSTDFNTAGVQNYPSMVIGLEAWNKTLHNGHYDKIIDCLLDNADPQTTLEAIAASPWGYPVDKTILPTILANFDHYAALPVGGSEDGTTMEVINNEDVTATAAEETDGIVSDPVPTPANAHVQSPAIETKDATVTEGNNVLSALSAQLSDFISTHQSANSALAAEIRTHIAELEAVATKLESLV